MKIQIGDMVKVPMPTLHGTSVRVGFVKDVIYKEYGTVKLIEVKLQAGGYIVVPAADVQPII